MKIPHYTELGATLFIPASHKNLEAILLDSKYKGLKSLLIDTEDGLDEKDYESSLGTIAKLLPELIEQKLYIFIRPRDTQTLKTLLSFKDIEKIDGFILPKFSLTNAKEYLKLLENSEHCIMPSIEGSELFHQQELLELRDLLLTNKQKIVLVRFGLEDMLRQLGLRRSCEESVFDFAAINATLGNFIALFKSAGFAVSGGVYPCFDDLSGFVKDVKRDMREGLFSKTIIHPKQIDIVNTLYQVTKEEFDEAQKIINSNENIFSLNAKMAERTTMLPYSLEILKRAKVYGLR